MIAQEMVTKFVAATPSLLISHKNEQDDFAVNGRQVPDSSTKDAKKYLKGTMKKVICSLRTAIPLMKLKAADPKV